MILTKKLKFWKVSKMSKFKFKKIYTEITEQYKKDTEQLTADTKDDRDALTNAIINLPSNSDTSGGAGTGVLVETPAYKKWLVAKQKRNRFIGKSYMERASEYEREDEMVTQEHVVNDDDLKKMLDKGDDGREHISEEYDPNNAMTTDNERLDGKAAEFADLCVINSVVSRQISWEMEDLMEEVTEALKNLHMDEPEYQTPANLAEQVDKALKLSQSTQQLAYQAQKTDGK